MKKSKPTLIGELFDDFIDSSPTVSRRLAESRVADIWPRLVGIHAANHTISVEVKNGALTAKISSSVVRHEIFMQRNALLKAINRELGGNIVRVIILK